MRGLLRRLWNTRHSAVTSLSPRRRRGERARERGNPMDTPLLSLAPSSLGGGEGDAHRGTYAACIPEIHQPREIGSSSATPEPRTGSWRAAAGHRAESNEGVPGSSFLFWFRPTRVRGHQLRQPSVISNRIHPASAPKTVSALERANV